MGQAGYPDYWLRGARIQKVDEVVLVDQIKLVDLIDKINLIDTVNTISNVSTLNTLNTIKKIEKINPTATENVVVDRISRIDKINPSGTENVVINRIDLIDFIKKIDAVGLVLSEWPLGWFKKPFYLSKVDGVLWLENREDAPTANCTEAKKTGVALPAGAWTSWITVLSIDVDLDVRRGITMVNTSTGQVKYAHYLLLESYISDYTYKLQSQVVIEILRVHDTTETSLGTYSGSVKEESITTSLTTYTIGWTVYTLGWGVALAADQAFVAGDKVRVRFKVNLRVYNSEPSNETGTLGARIYHDPRNPDTTFRPCFAV